MTKTTSARLTIHAELVEMCGKQLADRLWIGYEKAGFEGMLVELHEALVFGETFRNARDIIKRHMPETFTATFRETARLSRSKLIAA